MIDGSSKAWLGILLRRYALLFGFSLAFCLAQRSLTASAILVRPSGERFRFFLAGLDSAGILVFFLGLTRPTEGRATEMPEAASRDRACCRRAISSSI